MFSAYRVFSLLHPARPRHPLLQALLAVVVVCAFVVLLVVGAIIGLLVMAIALLARAFGFSRPFVFNAGVRPQPEAASSPPSQPQSNNDGDVIDGEFHVVDKSLRHGPQA